MPTYSTPLPIDLAINVQVGRIDVHATDRADTVVTISPTNPAKGVDQRGVTDTKIEFDGERLTVVGPRPKISWIGAGPTDSIDVKVEVPSGSRLTAEIAVGGAHTTGRLGATRIKSATGAVDIEATADLWMRVSHGSATVGTADGSADITASYGQIRIGTVTGDAVLKSSYGGVQIGESGGDLEAKLSYGDLEITRALAGVSAKTAFGGIVLNEVSSGSIDLQSGFGRVDVGVRPGVPAWLDLSSKDGRVRNDLDSESAPSGTERTVAVRVRTQSGDVSIYRAEEVAR